MGAIAKWTRNWTCTIVVIGWKHSGRSVYGTVWHRACEYGNNKTLIYCLSFSQNTLETQFQLLKSLHFQFCLKLLKYDLCDTHRITKQSNANQKPYPQYTWDFCVCLSLSLSVCVWNRCKSFTNRKLNMFCLQNMLFVVLWYFCCDSSVCGYCIWLVLLVVFGFDKKNLIW